MQYSIYINQLKCLEWGLNWHQGAVLDLYTKAATWAEPVIIGDRVYYWVARQRVIDQLPTMAKKPGAKVSKDTIYRVNKFLHKRGLIDYMKVGRKDCVMILPKGKEWLFKKSDINPSSDLNPSKGGFKPEKSPDINPTYNNTNKDKSIKDEKVFTPPSLKELEKLFYSGLEGKIDVFQPEHWAVWEAKEFEQYWSKKDWKRGKKLIDVARSVTGWITSSRKREQYKRVCPDSPDAGKTRWQIEKEMKEAERPVYEYSVAEIMGEENGIPGDLFKTK